MDISSLSWIFLAVGIILAGGIGYGMGESAGRQTGIAEGIKKQGEETIIERQHKEKAENINKIQSYMRGKTEITNNEIENHFGFSNATTERYLNDLEKTGHLKQLGTVGTGVSYKVLI